MDKKRKLFFGLFIFPLLIAFGMAMLLAVVVFLTNEEETPETLIAAIKTGSPSKRWQKAFELSNELNRSEKTIRASTLVNEALHIFEDKVHYDSKTRSYMAVALSHFNEPRVVLALQEALSESDEDIQIYSLWSLGILNAKQAAPKISSFLKSDNADLRKTAAYVLGVMGERSSVRDLEILLDDPIMDVRWNAALSLARLGENSGFFVLAKMLERNALKSAGTENEDEIEKIMVNATKGLALINDAKSIKILELVAREEKNLRVRQAAMDALAYQKEKFFK